LIQKQITINKYFNHLITYFTHKQSIAVGSAFTLLGFMFGTWATFIPFVKAKFQLDDAKLGLLLLCFPVGAAIFNPFSAWVIRRLGMRTATITGMIIVSLMYVLPVNMPSVFLTGLALCFTGMSIAQLNVAMNNCTAVIEQNDNINIMSTSHGMFSVGLMLGSLVASFSYGIGNNPSHHVLYAGFLGILATWFFSKDILSIQNPLPITKPNGEITELSESKETLKNALLIMIIISICSNITEGSMADWTAVFMKDIVKSSDYMIGWGLSGYSFFMAIGRFSGDGILPVFGGKKLLLIGSIIVAVGLLVAICFPFPLMAIVGFSLVGFGISFTSPIIYGSSARIPGYGNGKGLAILNSFGMIGFLGGPVLIGFLSRTFDLRIAFCFLVILVGIWGTFTRKVKLY
jgi:MFS family permease